MATARLRAGGTATLRTLPDDLAENTNALRITAFAIDPQSRELAFEVAWASNLFDAADSRNLHLFSATNLNARRWVPLGAFAMPLGTNTCAFAVTSNEVDAAWRPWFLASFAHAGFYSLGLDFDSDGDGLADVYERFWSLTDSENADTDGDGLTDGEELSASVATEPLLYDTDGDGVGDGDEVAAGANPSVADTDGDGLTDARELGTMTALDGDDFLWFDLADTGTRLITGATADGNEWKVTVPGGCVIDNVCYTNALVQVDGTVHLLCPTNTETWASACSYGTLANSLYSDCHVTVALCGADLYAKTNDWGSQILCGEVERDGRSFTIIEYRNVGLYDHCETNETLTCQLILPHDETNTVYVSYLCASNLLHEVDLVVGVQRGGLKSWKTDERYYNLTWPLADDFPQGGVTIKYQIGTGTNPAAVDTDGDGLPDAVEILTTFTDPLVADTDGDGLGDADEVDVGTDPLRADTDGDGLPDGWEHDNGLNPLVDDSSADSDGDGLDNVREYALGTSPVAADTDNDGLFDREEVGWWKFANALPAFDVAGGTSLFVATQNYDHKAFVVPLPFVVRVGGFVCTNVTIGVNGIVGLMSHGRPDDDFYDDDGNDDLTTSVVDDHHTAIAAYWDDLYAPANGGAQITCADVETNGLRYAVVEYANMRLYSRRNDASCTATFQVVIPQTETNTVYVHYIDMASAFDGSGATIGAQLPNGERTYQVSCNAAGAISNGMVVAYHFGTGSDPTVADTDGDGLNDGVEAALGTSARYADTDLDGLSDGWEHDNGLDPLSDAGDDGADGDPDDDLLVNAREMEYGTNPQIADTDGDGLCDGLETGSVFATNAVPWLSFDAYEDLTVEISTNARQCVSRPTPCALRIQGETVTNMTISANGLLFLNRAGYANPGDSTSYESFEYAVDEDALVLAPYLHYAYVRSDIEDRPTSIRYGTATHGDVGYVLVEWLNSYADDSTWRTNAISFQLAIPTNAPDRAYARYRDLTGEDVDGRDACIGMQTFDGTWLHSWCLNTEGKVFENLALEFRFGENTDPLLADTDGDGLDDGDEIAIGTSPLRCDTDGDGLPDEWEVAYGLDPLSAEGDNGAAGDPDDDGFDNLGEYETGTDPNCADTDGDSLSDGSEVNVRGCDPRLADTDGDGLSDGDEVNVQGGNPCLADTDGDGLSDGEELSLGTALDNPDSDGDGLSDGWESSNGLDPLSGQGEDGGAADIDGDGLTNLQEQSHGGNPRNADTDSDGLSDAREVQFGANPSSADTDLDGLADGREVSLGLDPLQPDTDGDGMNDEWEQRYRNAGFDPVVDNSSDDNPDNDRAADPDGDGIPNGEECEWNMNPVSADTDGDGVNDGAEIGQNSDPMDADDEGRPNTRIPVALTFGDPSGSHSEKYRLVVTSVSGVGESPVSFSWINENYGVCETKTAMLKPGWKYEVRLHHAGTKERGSGYPDYDYLLRINSASLPDNVVVDDPDTLFRTDDTSVRFAGAGKVATIAVYAVTEVAICDPDNASWAELNAARVILDDEALRIKVTVSPKISSLAQCRQMFGTALTVKTAGTCPNGAEMPIDADAVLADVSDTSEIRITKTRRQLKSLGLLPALDEDGVNEMAWVDIVQTAGQSLADSEAFSSLGHSFRGKATLDATKTLDSTPPNSQPSDSFFKAAGCELVTASFNGKASSRRQIMNQADILYYSGHGNGATGGINRGFTPSRLGEYWKRDLNCVVISGCSVLNIAGHRIKSFGRTTRFKRWLRNQEDRSVGTSWETTADAIFLGYCYTAPLDSQGATAIATVFVNGVKGGKSCLQAWKDANDRDAGRNACAIDCTITPHEFWYWDETSGRPVWTRISKGDASW